MAIPQEVVNRIMGKLKDLMDLMVIISKHDNLNEDHRKVLILLSQATLKATHHVILAANAKHELASGVNVNYFAWAVRSLYEARVWVRFCPTKENAQRFAAGTVLDIADTLDAFMGIARQLPTVNIEQIKEVRRSVGQLRGAAPYSDKELRLRVLDVAVVGLEDEHGSIYKFLSKVLHVTALSAVWSIDDKGFGETFIPFVTYAENCLDDINLSFTALVEQKPPLS